MCETQKNVSSAYRRGTDVLTILLKSDPSFYVIGRFCNNKK